MYNRLGSKIRQLNDWELNMRSYQAVEEAIWQHSPAEFFFAE